MEAKTPSTFDSDLLQTVYELRSLVILAFVLVALLSRELNALGLEAIGVLLLGVLAPALLVVAVGALLNALRWVAKRLAG